MKKKKKLADFWIDFYPSSQLPVVQWPVRRIFRFFPHSSSLSSSSPPHRPPQLALPLSSIGWAIAGFLKYLVYLLTTQQFVAQAFHIFPAAQLKRYVQVFMTSKNVRTDSMAPTCKALETSRCAVHLHTCFASFACTGCDCIAQMLPCWWRPISMLRLLQWGDLRCQMFYRWWQRRSSSLRLFR